MAFIRNRLSVLFQAFLLVIVVHLDTCTGSQDGPNINVFSISNVNITNIVNEVLAQDWTENLECLNELNEIKNGLANSELWAMKIVDACGRFPPGLLNGNSFEPGSFSECFHIDKNGTNYKTQYCIATLSLGAKKYEPQNVIWKRIYDEPDFSFGICLPATCATNYLQSVVNNVIRAKWGNVAVEVHNDTRQFEERPTKLTNLDWAAIGLLGTVLLMMIASTVYDVYCSMNDRSKYEPFLVFSIYTNGRQLFPHKNTKVKNAIQCMNGIRALAIMNIVFVQSNWKYIAFPLREKAEFTKFLETYGVSIYYNITGIDPFFAISAFLVAMKLLKRLKKKRSLNIFSLYLHRYLRITPLLAVTILFSMTLLRFLGSGPFWPYSLWLFAGSCKENWWTTLLYIQNYRDGQICLSHSWYLSADTQLFVISPVLVYLVYRYKKTTFVGLLIAALVSMGLMVFDHIDINLANIYHPGLGKIFVSTHLRLPPWLIGFITGCIFVEYPMGSIRIPKKLNLCAWIVSLSLIAVTTLATYPFFQHDSKTTPLQYGLYHAYCHPLFAIGLCYIIFACANNAGGPIDWFLSHPLWQPIAKLSYAIYLVHLPIINWTTALMKFPIYFNEITAIQYFFGNFVLSCLVAIPATLAFELPITAIEKLISKPRKNREMQQTLNHFTYNQRKHSC